MKSLYCGKDIEDSRSDHSMRFQEPESSLEQYSKPKKKYTVPDSKYTSVNSKKKKSIVWKYFDYNEIEGIGICNICLESCSSKNAHTSHLIKHLKRWHSQVLNQDEDFDQKQANLKPYMGNKKVKLDISSIQRYSNNNIQDFFEKAQIKRSKVLNFFKLDRISNKGYCQLCNEIVKMKGEKYKQLKDHMQEKHPCVMEQYEKEIQGSIGNLKTSTNFDKEIQNSTFKKNDKSRGFDEKKSLGNQEDDEVMIIETKKSSAFPRGPCARQTVQIIKQLQNKVKTALFITNKDNKPLFEVNFNDNSVLCQLCDAKYFIKEKGTEPFIIHAQKIHLLTYQEQRRNQKIFKNSLGTKTQAQETDEIGKQVQKKINYYRNYLPLSLDSMLLGQSCQSQNLLLKNLIEKLGQIKQIKIKQKIVGNTLKYLIITKNILNTLRAQFLYDSVSLWYVKEPTKQISLKSVIYLIGQDDRLCPFVVGVVLLLQENYQCYHSVLQTLCDQDQINSRKLMAYGPQLFLRSMRQFMHKQFCQMNHGIKCPKSVLVEDKLSKKSSQMAIDKFVHNLTEDMLTNSLDVDFLGFLFTKEFFRKILDLLPDQDKKINNIYELITSIFKQISYNPEEDPNKFKGLKKKVNLAITSNHTMTNLKQILVSAEVMMKIAVCFVFSLFMSAKQINQNLYQVYHCEGQEINTVEVFRDDQMSSWKCICQLGNLIGLPCPHILAVLPKIDVPLYKFINPRWIAQKQINPKLFQKYQPSLATIQLSQRDFYDFLLT